MHSLIFKNNEVESLRWRDAILTFIEKPFNTKPYLVIINPISGTGHGLKIWEKIVQPMLHEASIVSNVIITKHANHVYEYMQDFNPYEYSVIVCIGGDGTIYEIINGIANRSGGQTVLKTLPVAPIPCG